ncbi:MAG: hypothetical protein IT318_22075 [Anaerolineales bacterium]|nr:hypothetical protein [Anaerolineales bacterium]
MLRAHQVFRSLGLDVVLGGVNLGLNCGDRAAVVGPNASGKTTLSHNASSACWPTAA